MRIQNTQNQAISVKNPHLNANQQGKSREAGAGEDAVFKSSVQPKAVRLSQMSLDSAARVMRARTLLQSGKLDTPANIRAAATNMLKFGF